MNGFWKCILLLMFMPLLSKAQQNLALEDLRSLLPTQKEWIKVHVAEFLLWQKYEADLVRDMFLEEEQRFAHIPKYRIGIWRVLAQAAQDDKSRQHWIDKILTAYNDLKGQDRLHAIETLAKLGYSVEIDKELLSNVKEEKVDAFAIYSLWNSAHHPKVGKQFVRETCLSLIQQKIMARQYGLIPVLSYVLRFMGSLPPGDWNKLKGITEGMKERAGIYASLLATLSITAEDQGSEKYITNKQSLMELKDDTDAVPNILFALAECGSSNDLEELLKWYEDIRNTGLSSYHADIHATAAYAILKISGRLKN